MTPPKAEELKFCLKFLSRGPAANVGGVIKAEYQEVDELERVRAKIVPRLGGEEVIAGRMKGKVPCDIWVRSSVATRALSNTCQAVDWHSGEVYNLGQPIDPFGTKRWLLIQATSGGANV